MKNLRLKPDGAMNCMTKRKPAVMAETKKSFEEQAEPDKNADSPHFLFQGSNNQNKGLPERMQNLNLVFPRQSPWLRS